MLDIANEMRDRLKENISIIKQHNEMGLPVKHITKGQKYEVEVIDEIVRDISSIIEKMENETLIELPCKVGQTVYMLFEGEITPLLITRISTIETVGEFSRCYDATGKNVATSFTDSHIGKTMFLTKDEAEQKLKEMRGGDDT